jgi:hypothetical protein
VVSRRAGVATALIALLLCGCHVELGNYRDQLAAAETGVAEFRRLYNEQKFEALYDISAQEMRQTVTREDFVVAARHTAKVFGTHKATTRTVSACFPHQVRLVHLSVFEKGNATEMMVWVVRGGKASLLMYQASPGHSELKEEPSTTCKTGVPPPASPQAGTKA